MRWGLGRVTAAVVVTCVTAVAGAGVAQAGSGTRRIRSTLAHVRRLTRRQRVYVVRYHGANGPADTIYYDQRKRVLGDVRNGSAGWQFGDQSYYWPGGSRRCWIKFTAPWHNQSVAASLHEDGVWPLTGARYSMTGRTILASTFYPASYPPGTGMYASETLTFDRRWRITRLVDRFGGSSPTRGGTVATAKVTYPRSLAARSRRPTGPFCSSPASLPHDRALGGAPALGL